MEEDDIETIVIESYNGYDEDWKNPRFKERLVLREDSISFSREINGSLNLGPNEKEGDVVLS